MAEGETVELLQMDYSRIMNQDKECIEKVMEALGPGGAGLLAITQLPNLQLLRKSILPLARKLALMDDTQRRQILKDHGLGTDVSLRKADRNVSSFAAQLNFGQNRSSMVQDEDVLFRGDITYKQRKTLLIEENLESKFIQQELAQTTISQGLKYGDDFEGLGNCFRQLGLCMLDVGLGLARMCDRSMGIELEKAISDARTAKGRLIHYHSLCEKSLLLNLGNTKRTNQKHSVKEPGCQSGWTQSRNVSLVSGGKNVKGKNHFTMIENGASCHHLANILPGLWQEWHYDYGIFTLLTAPLFLSSSPLRTGSDENINVMDQAKECSSPDGHTYLKILNTVNGKVMFASAPPSSLIVQVGEAAQILSGGKLCATAHCVCRPAKRTDVSRETFVVFLQPAWNKSLYAPNWFYGERASTKHTFGQISPNPSRELIQGNDFEENVNVLSLALNKTEPIQENGGQESAHGTETTIQNLNESNMLIRDIQKIVPPLSTRWKEGQTFAEFSRETTRKYYGTDGIQSNR